MNLRILSTALLAALATFCGGTGIASATVVINEEGNVYTSTIKAESEGSTTLHGPASVTCGKSSVQGSVESHGESVTVEGKLSSLSFSECGSADVTVSAAGSLIAHATEAGDGTLTSSGASIKVVFTSLGLTCEYTTSSTDIGTLTGSITTDTANATLDINSASIPRTGGSAFCGSSGTWTGSYKVTTPEALVVSAEAEAGFLVKVTPAVAFKKETETTPVEIENIHKTIDIKQIEVELGNSAKKSFNIAGTCNAALNAGKKCTETVECKTGGKNGAGLLFIESKDPIVMESTKLTC